MIFTMGNRVWLPIINGKFKKCEIFKIPARILIKATGK